MPDATSRAKAVASVQPLLNLWPVANGAEVTVNGAATGIATYTGTAPQLLAAQVYADHGRHATTVSRRVFQPTESHESSVAQ